MRKIILMGSSRAGKTTLTQALRGEKIVHKKTQYINHYDVVIDTPGEYLQCGRLGRALALYSYEADIVGLLASSIEPFSLYPPNITCMVNREVIGIVTKIDQPGADLELAATWLRNAGCEIIFYVNSKTGEGVDRLLEYLKEPGDVLPWEKEKNREK